MSSTKTIYLFAISILLFASCEKKTENTMTISGSIDGLKKGTLYLQRTQDSTLVTLDSVLVKGDGAFSFSQDIESPEVFYLYLDKADNNDVNDRITFFGEPGEISINTSWNTFDTKSKITGSKSQVKFAEFQAILSNFNKKELVLFQEILSKQDSVKLDSLQKLRTANILRRYQYILNFGLTNPDSYVTPYVTLTEAPDANPKYLDSIYNSLNPEVANSKYGKRLNTYLESLK